jgi:3-methyladenine DNA glycosylase AlkD
MKALKERIIREFEKVSSKEKAKDYKKFYKTGKGEYGEGDVFIGVTVPEVRKLCKKFLEEVTLKDLGFFISNKIHEYRLFALLTLTYMYEKVAKEKNLEERKKRQGEIFDYYIKNRQHINNWDLVDASAYKIVGEYLKERDRSVLYDLIKSDSIWDQRIAIISTFAFIKNHDFKEILKFGELLLNHEHHLIHKALGWMLREVGKRDIAALRKFLNRYATRMPRTMLRYSIEKLGKEERQYYMSL